MRVRLPRLRRAQGQCGRVDAGRALPPRTVLEHAEVHTQLQASTGYAKIDEVPFDFQRRRMSVVVEKDHATHI